MLTVCARMSVYEQLAMCAKTWYCSFLLWYFYSLSLLTDRHLPRLAPPPPPPRLLLIMKTLRFWILLSQYRSSRVRVAQLVPASVCVCVSIFSLFSHDSRTKRFWVPSTVLPRREEEGGG